MIWHLLFEAHKTLLEVGRWKKGRRAWGDIASPTTSSSCRNDAAPRKGYLEILEVAGVHRKKWEHSTRRDMIGRRWVGLAQMWVCPE